MLDLAPTCPQLSTPPLWQTLELIADPIRFFEKYRQQYGDRFAARVLGWNSPSVYFFGDPDAIRAIFSASPDQFALGKVTHVFRPFAGEQSLIMLDGDRHQRQRQLLVPPLHGERIHVYGEIICQLTREAIARFPQNTPFAIRDRVSEIALETILRVVFGWEPGSKYECLKSAIARLLETISQPIYSSLFFFEILQRDWGAWSLWGRFVRQMQFIDREIYAEIARRREVGDRERSDVLSLLLAATDEKGRSLSDVELRDQLITILFLGHETTASALAWAFYWIYSRPEVRQTLQQELQDAGQQENPQAIAQLPYLSAVCKETLRLYPIALISQPRVVRKPFALEGETFAPGAILVPNIYLAHHRPATYPDSHEFRPERFLERKFTPYEYLPFGGGTRACIGAAFSLYEMKLILGTIVSRLNLELAPQAPIRPVRRGITIVPSGGVTVQCLSGYTNLKKEC